MTAGGKPIDSRNTLGHGLLPHPLLPSPSPPAFGFYLPDTHQSRISAWSGLRMKLMWGRASRVWEARDSGHRLASGLIAGVYRALRSVDTKKATQEVVVFNVFVRTTRRESSLNALWYERKGHSSVSYSDHPNTSFVTFLYRKNVNYSIYSYEWGMDIWFIFPWISLC